MLRLMPRNWPVAWVRNLRAPDNSCEVTPRKREEIRKGYATSSYFDRCRPNSRMFSFTPLRPLWPIVLALLALPGWTVEAFAHASNRGHVLLLPTGHYLVGGAIAVAASFLALALLPPASFAKLME